MARKKKGERSSSACLWYKKSFGTLYPQIYSHRDEETAVTEIENLLDFLRIGAGALVLDVCCGGGRHLLPLRKKKLAAFGIDLSAPLLCEASEKPGLDGRLVMGDMRRLPFGGAFDLVVNLFSSFGYFEEESENEHALAEMVQALKPGGTLVMDHINAGLLEKTIIPESVGTFEYGTVKQRRKIVRGRVIKHIDVIHNDGEQQHFIESIALYTPDQLITLCKKAGLSEPRFMGNFDGEPFAAESPRMILVAERA